MTEGNRSKSTGVDPRRVTALNTKQPSAGPVLYWMSRDQRIQDNWALLYARELAHNSKEPFAIGFALSPTFLGASARQYDFMLRGLEETASEAHKLNIPFYLLRGLPDTEIPAFAKKIGAGAVVTDFSPLAIGRTWRTHVARALHCPLYEVDAHNIVPCRVASEKREFGAYTLRPKIKKMLPHFLIEFPRVTKQNAKWTHEVPHIDWNKLRESIPTDADAPPVSWLTSGAKAAHRVLTSFVTKNGIGYDERRNNPTETGQSNLSPYIHFGQIAAQRIALSVSASALPKKDKDAYLEELIVRRELSDNFCYYTKKYDTFSAFPDWARQSLDAHRKDKRAYHYTYATFAAAKTHDELWNAAQRELLNTGKMHGYMRMYWAKKILEWTKDPETAMKIAVRLNDTYELDGRDPNGYAGIAWSIGGVHDRAWFNRPIFGKIRYMSEGGARSKFDVDAYIKAHGADGK